MQVTMTVNGEQVIAEVEPRLLLVHFLRENLALTGTHWGCDTSNCGACVVQMDGVPVKSCTVLTAMASGHSLTTVEGLDVGGRLDPVQQGFMQEHGLHLAAVLRVAHGHVDGERLMPAFDEIRTRTVAGLLPRQHFTYRRPFRSLR